jgi:hypothetical protein
MGSFDAVTYAACRSFEPNLEMLSMGSRAILFFSWNMVVQQEANGDSFVCIH